METLNQIILWRGSCYYPPIHPSFSCHSSICPLLVSRAQAFWVRLLTQKYLIRSTFHLVQPRPRDSTLWRLMLQHRHFISDHLRSVVGNDLKVDIMSDQWIPGLESTPPLRDRAPLTSGKVVDLIYQCNGRIEWKIDILHRLRPAEVVSKILSIPLGGTDIPCWGPHPAGSRPFKALCQLIQTRSFGPHRSWRRLWNLSLQSKLNSLLGRLSLTTYQLPTPCTQWRKT